MSVETSYATSPAHRCLWLDRCERRCWPRPVQSSFRTRSTRLAVAHLSSLGDELDEVHERLGRLLETAPRVEFQLAVKLVATREDVGARQAAERETRAIGAAADRLQKGREAGAPRGIERVLGDMRKLA